jgi:Fis family transcriptional regulator
MEASQEDHEVIKIDNQETAPLTLAAYVKQTIDVYFSQLNGHDIVDLYAMVIREVERPLLEAALAHSGHNQTKAAKALGLSRSTLRKKLEHYNIT